MEYWSIEKHNIELKSFYTINGIKLHLIKSEIRNQFNSITPMQFMLL